MKNVEEVDAARERIAELAIAISVRSVPHILGSLLQTRLTIQQLKVLTTLVVFNGATTSELVAQFSVSMATMSKMLDRLVEQELIERIPDPRDKRARQLKATELGREVVSEIVGARPELGDEILAGLSLHELESLEVGMRAVNRELRRRDGGRARCAVSS